MQGISATWNEQLKKSHIMSSKVEILKAGAVIADTAGSLRVTAGNVQVDASAAILRTCRATIVDPSGLLIPSKPTDILAPYGNEIKLYRGIGTEFKSLGLFRFEVVDVKNDGGVVIELDGYDRSSTVQEARFESPYTVAAGVNYATAIQTLIASRMPGLTFVFSTTTRVTPLLVFEEGSDPWEAARDMARSIGMEIFFDVDGYCVLRAVPNPLLGISVFEYTEGNSSILNTGNRMTAKPSYNKFIVSGETIDGAAPVRAEAFDNNPLSPTYYNGPFGKRPRFFKSQFITTTAQCQEAANGMMLNELGGVEQLSFTAIPNPAHDPGDIVHVKDSKIGIDVLAIMDSFNIPLTPEESMSVITRARRSAV